MTKLLLKHVVSRLVIMMLSFVALIPSAQAEEISLPSIRTDALTDPLFGIMYRPTEVHFEIAPDDIYKCGDLASRRGNLFLFGHVTKDEVDFYYVYGWIEVEPDGPSQDFRRFEAESDSGIIVIISASGCREVGAGYAWSPDKADRQEAEKHGITDEIAAAILADAVDRAVLAFGGKTEFLRTLAATGIDESTLPEQVQAKLAALRAAKTEKK